MPLYSLPFALHPHPRDDHHMPIILHISGDIIERQELLNGTRTVTLEGTTADGAWLLTGVVSWNLGLVDYPGEGDLTLSRGDDEVFATLVRAVPTAADDEQAEVLLDAEYAIDGAAGAFLGASGSVTAQISLTREQFQSRWVLPLSLDRT